MAGGDKNGELEIPPDRRALQLVRDAGGALFIDSAGQPRIRRLGDDPDCVAWPLAHPRIRSWISKLYSDDLSNKTKSLLHKHQLDRVVEVLAGDAEKSNQSDMELCNAIESDPLFQLILELVKFKQIVRTTATELWEELERKAEKLSRLRQLPTWPEGPEGVGRRIRKLEPLLDQAGVSLEIKRKTKVRTLIFKDRGDSKSAKPSSKPSSADGSKTSDSLADDTNDGSKVTDYQAMFHDLDLMNGETNERSMDAR